MALLGAVAFSSGCAGTVSPSNATSPQQGEAIAATPGSVSFGNVPIGVTNTQTVQLLNTSKNSVTLMGIAVSSGSGISTSGLSLPATLSVGASASFTASFTAKAAGSVTGSITVSDSADRAPLNIPSTATGVASNGKLTASSTTLGFANVVVDTTATEAITLTNQGNVDVQISKVTVTGPGFNSGSGQMTIAAGQSASLPVNFDPTSTGLKSGVASVYSNAPNSPLQILLNGTGVATTSHYVSLNWNPSTSSVIGYFVYRGTQSGGPYAKIVPAADAQTGYTDLALPTGQYFYVVTAVDSSNVESIYSNEVQVAIP